MLSILNDEALVQLLLFKSILKDQGRIKTWFKIHFELQKINYAKNFLVFFVSTYFFCKNCQIWLFFVNFIKKILRTEGTKFGVCKHRGPWCLLCICLWVRGGGEILTYKPPSVLSFFITSKLSSKFWNYALTYSTFFLECHVSWQNIRNLNLNKV